MNDTRTGFFDSLIAAARENPLSAALVGGGALWLLVGDEKLKGAARSAVDVASDAVDSGSSTLRAPQLVCSGQLRPPPRLTWAMKRASVPAKAFAPPARRHRRDIGSLRRRPRPFKRRRSFRARTIRQAGQRVTDRRDFDEGALFARRHAGEAAVGAGGGGLGGRRGHRGRISDIRLSKASMSAKSVPI